jgi:hypothetical protein
MSAIPRDCDGVSFTLKDDLDELRHIRLIFNDENSGAHRGLFLLR